jgi:hypothetical protein
MKHYELIIRYQHCFGQTMHSCGTVESEQEALEWVDMKTRGEGEAPVRVENDPVCTCTAAVCPFKFQRPTFMYREIEKDPAGTNC